MAAEYVEQREENCFLRGSRVSLDVYLQAKNAAYERARRSQTHISKDLRAHIEQAREHLEQRT